MRSVCAGYSKIVDGPSDHDCRTADALGPASNTEVLDPQHEQRGRQGAPNREPASRQRFDCSFGNGPASLRRWNQGRAHAGGPAGPFAGSTPAPAFPRYPADLAAPRLSRSRPRPGSGGPPPPPRNAIGDSRPCSNARDDPHPSSANPAGRMTTRRHCRSPGTLPTIISIGVGGLASKIAPAVSRFFLLVTAASARSRATSRFVERIVLRYGS